MNRLILLIILSALGICCASQNSLPTAIKVEFYNQQIADNSIADTTKINYIDSLLSLSQKDSCRLLLKKGDLCFASLKYKHAASGYIKSLSFNSLNISETCHAIYNAGLSDYYTGKYDRSIKFAQQLQAMDKPDSLAYYDIFAYCLLCNDYIRFQRKDLAYKYIQDATSRLKDLYFPEKKKNDILCLYHRTLASVYRSNECYSEAFAEMSEARKYSTNKLSDLSCDLISATIYEKNTEPEIAAEFYRKIMNNPIKHYHKAVAVNNYIFYLLNQKAFTDVISIYSANKDLIASLQNEHLRLSIYNSVAIAYGNLNDFQSGYNFLSIASEISDSLFSYENRQYISDITQSYEIGQLTESNKLLSDHNSDLTRILIIGGVLVALSCVGIYLVVRKLRKLQSEKNSLTDKLDNINKFHSDKLQTSYDEIESRNRKLVTLTMQMAQINDTLNNITKQISAQGTSDSDKLKAIASDIKTLDYQENMWNTFRVYFEDSHKAFFDNLFNLHPDLSNGEIKMCAYTLMNMTSKEIAQLTNRSVRTVENIKYRLTKKLGISNEGISLYAYLQSLT